MKHQFKLLTALIVIAVMLLVMLSACAGTGKEQSGTTTGTTEKTQEEPKPEKKLLELTLTTFTDWVTAGGLNAMIEKVNSNSDLGVKITINAIQGGQQGTDMLKVRFVSGDYPELLAYQGAIVAYRNFSKAEAFIDIRGEWVESFPKNIVDSVRCTVDGRVIAQPFSGADSSVMFYNKPLFKQLNLNIPKTWTELLQICEEIKAAGKIPVYYSGKDAWTLQILPQGGWIRDYVDNYKEYQDKFNKGEIKYIDRKEYIDALYKAKELLDKKLVNETWLSDTYDMAQQALANGDAAMYPMATWIVAEIDKKFPEKLEDIGAFPIPFDNADEKLIHQSVQKTLLATDKNKDVERIKEVFNYIATKEVQMEYFKNEPAIPLFTGIDSSEIDLPSCMKDVIEILNSKNVKIAPGINEPYASGVSLPNAYQNILIGEQTPEDVMKEQDTGIENAAKAAGDTNWK